MAKRPFIVSDNETAVPIPVPTEEELEKGTARLLRKFAGKHGEKYPRLLAALRATEEKGEDENGS